MKSYNSDEIAVNVWLNANHNYAQSSVFCFRERLLLEKRTNVMINSTSCGPIGVKDIVDALRLAPDEEKKEQNGRDLVAATVDLRPDEMIQVHWVPADDCYVFQVTPVEKGMACGHDLQERPKWKDPFLILRGIAECSPITLQRNNTSGKTEARKIQIFVATGCANIETFPYKSVGKS